MKLIQQPMASTHVDSHGERMDRDALQQMADNMQHIVAPVSVEHDPRNRPRGRIRQASVHELPDGEFGLMGEIELFEPGDKPEFLDGRELPVPWCDAGQFSLTYDRNFRSDDDQRDIGDLENVLNCKASETLKKSIDPIGVFLICAGAAVTAFAATFAKLLAKDAYNLLKNKLKDIFARFTDGEEEKILQISITSEMDGYRFEAQLLATNPQPEDFEFLLTDALVQMDRIVQRIRVKDQRIRRVVFEVEGREVVLKFGVRSDAVPLAFGSASASELGGDASAEE